MAAHDWATWHPIICQQNCHVSTSNWTTCCHVILATSLVIRPVSNAMSSPRQKPHCLVISTSSADVIRATCHPSSGDTCHFRIGPTARQKCRISLTCVTLWSRHVSCTESSMCRRMDLPHVPVWTDTCPVRTVRTCTVSIQNFACLAWWTECDIFSIQTPFDKVNIPSESGR